MNLVARMTFFGETHDIFCQKVGNKYGLFVDNCGKFEQLEDTKLRKTEQEAIDELIEHYSGGNVYDIEYFQ